MDPSEAIKEVPHGLKQIFDYNFLIKPAHTIAWWQNSRIRNLQHALDRRSAVELALALAEALSSRKSA
jgi:hypothetical protein